MTHVVSPLAHGPWSFESRPTSAQQFGHGSRHPSPRSQIPSDAYDVGETMPKTPPKTTQIIKYGRRPCVMLVVLFSSKRPVLKYAKEVGQQFLRAGIDVILMTNVVGSGCVKPENLADIIVSTPADSLVVVGDRNKTNDSVHVKSDGSISETRVACVINAMWKDWPMNPLSNDLRIESLSGEELETLLDQHTGCGEIEPRVRFIVTTAGALGRHNWPPMATVCALEYCAVRLHRQLTEARRRLLRMDVVDGGTSTNKGAFYRGATYDPNRDGTEDAPIAARAQTRLVDLVEAHLHAIEDALALFHPAMTALWTQHIKELRAKRTPTPFAEARV